MQEPHVVTKLAKNRIYITIRMPMNYQLSRNCSITISFLLYFIALLFRLCACKVIYIPEVRLVALLAFTSKLTYD